MNRISRPIIHLATRINLQLGLFGRETMLATTALDALAALADSGPHAGVERGAVAGAPGPDATVGGVHVAQGLAALVAEPDGVFACAWGAEECRCGEAVRVCYSVVDG